MKIAINAGHFPTKDSGAVGSRMTEANYTRDIMKRVAAYLEKVGYDVLQIQKDELHEITNAANAYNANLFVSIHCNACFSHNARGTETFSYYGVKDGKRLAACIQKQIISSIGTKDRGAKEAGFYVLKHTKMTAALVECAFIDNIDDETILIQNKDQIAAAIARGITDYIRGDYA